MQLYTLGGLALMPSGLTRPKPLLLLCYLALEGPQERRHLAELFWSEAARPLASLSTALYQILKAAPGAIGSDEVRVWSLVQADVQALLARLDQDPEAWETSLYPGAFLAGVAVEWSTELEEWVYETRERIAARVRKTLLALAEGDAAAGRFSAAAKQAEAAYRLPGASEPEPEELSRFYGLFVAGESDYAREVARGAEAYDINISLSPAEARAQLKQIFIGRQSELDRLAALRPGQWGWVRGGAGIGKTSLLQRLPGRYLPARSGLPYATLEPLLGEVLGEGEEALLYRLRKQEGTLCLDDWEQVDEESQALLGRLKRLKPPLKIVVSSSAPPPFSVEIMLELHALPQEALKAHQDVWENTGGIPGLVGAHLRGEPLADALETCLLALSEEARRVYFALALLEEPDLSLVRRALELSAADMAVALEALQSSGLVAPSGEVWPSKLGRDQLDKDPTLFGYLALRIARFQEGVAAFPLYKASKLFWENEDLPAVRRAYSAWATELLRRGFPKRAVDVLAEIEDNDQVRLLKARALERSGNYQAALECLALVEKDSETDALIASIFYRLGQPVKAREAARRALDNSLESRASALSTLGELARFQGEHEQAAVYYRRSAALWQAFGDQGQWLNNLNRLGVAQHHIGEDAESTFRIVLAALSENLELRARVLLNLGRILEERDDIANALLHYKEAAESAEHIGIVELAARAWNNIAAVYHIWEERNEAKKAYLRALGLVQHTGDQEMRGTLLANLAELTYDYAAWLEALLLLEKAGYRALVESYRRDLSPEHPFRRREDAPTLAALQP